MFKDLDRIFFSRLENILNFKLSKGITFEKRLQIIKHYINIVFP